MTAPAEPWEDDLADAIALTAAVRAEDMEGVAAIVANMNPVKVAITLAKCLAEAAEESQAAPEYFRYWAAQAVRRP